MVSYPLLGDLKIQMRQHSNDNYNKKHLNHHQALLSVHERTKTSGKIIKFLTISAYGSFIPLKKNKQHLRICHDCTGLLNTGSSAPLHVDIITLAWSTAWTLPVGISADEHFNQNPTGLLHMEDDESKLNTKHISSAQGQELSTPQK